MAFKHFIQEKIVLPCSDIFLGQSVNYFFRFLQQSQYWSRQQIDDFQNERLKLMIAHAYENVPFYREKMDGLGLKPDDIQSKADLHKLPIISKAQIKKEGSGRFTAKNIPSKQITQQGSSGSTGEPLRFIRDKEANSLGIASNLFNWYNAGWRLGDRYVKLSQNPRKNPIKRLQDFVTNNLYLPTNPLIDSNFLHILKEIERYKPKVIRCYPDPLLFLARYKQNHPEFTYSPDFIATTGNTLFPKTREEIETAFGCKIYDSYSCEAAARVFECPTHSCYHSTEEYGISEVIDEQGNLIEKGVGRLVSTDLWNLAQPFIRYDTQDFIEIDNTPCECGRNHLKILRILGRDNEVLEMPSGRKFIVHNFTGFFLTDIPEIKKSIDQFQVLKKQDNSVIIRLVVNENYDREAENYLIAFWEKELGVPVSVECLSEIPIMQNNKRRFIVNE